MSISLCMIVKDEAENLPRCLESVQDLVHECIVVDTGSTDATCDIATRYGARVHSFTWNNDFAAARNVSLDYATGDWVLVLDADEVLTPEAATALKRLDQNESWQGMATDHIAMVNLVRLELGAPQAPYNLVSRFFRRLPGIVFQRPYHETVDDSVAQLQEQQPQWQVGTLDAVAIHHTGYQAEVVAQRDKFTRAQTIMEGYLEQHPDDSYLLNKLAALYLEQDRTTEALSLLDRALAQDNVDEITCYELHYHRGLALRMQQPTQAEAEYRLALKQPIADRLKLGAVLNLGSLKKSAGQIAEALRCFRQAVEIDPAVAVAHYNLGVAYRAQGQLQDAISAYHQAIVLDPNYAEAHQNLGVALLKTGQVEDALQAFHQAIKIYQHTEPLKAVSLRQGLQGLGLPKSLLAEANLLP
jgi:tetratricopeptide (TPR) repeat protein